MVLASVSFAQSPSSKMLKLIPELHKAVDADAKKVQEIYKDIHEHAELGFIETRTAKFVAKELKALGFDVKTKIGITGVVGILKNGNTGQGIYIDPERDFVAVMFSATPYVPPYGEIKLPAYMRAAAKMLAEE